MIVRDLLRTLSFHPKWLHIIGDISVKFLDIRAHGDYESLLSEELLNAKVSEIERVSKPWPWSQTADLEISVKL